MSIERPSSPQLSPGFVARAPRCRGGGSHGPQDAEGVADLPRSRCRSRLREYGPPPRGDRRPQQEDGESCGPAPEGTRRPCGGLGGGAAFPSFGLPAPSRDAGSGRRESSNRDGPGNREETTAIRRERDRPRFIAMTRASGGRRRARIAAPSPKKTAAWMDRSATNDRIMILHINQLKFFTPEKSWIRISRSRPDPANCQSGRIFPERVWTPERTHCYDPSPDPGSDLLLREIRERMEQA